MKVQMAFLVGVVAMSCLGIDMNAYKYGAKAKIVMAHGGFIPTLGENCTYVEPMRL